MISHKVALDTGKKRLLPRKTRGEEKKNIFPTESKENKEKTVKENMIYRI
jgi:hypothetical protein